MNIQYFYKKCNPQEKSKLKTLVESKLKSVSRVLASSPENLLEVKLEKTAKKSAFIVELVLRSEGKRLVSKEDDHTINEAVDIAWGELMGQIRKLKLKRGVKSPDQFRGRVAKDSVRYSDFIPVEDFSTLSKKEFFTLVEKYLKRGRQYVVSEIRFLEKTGELPVGELEADELVNDIVLGLWNERSTLGLSSANFLSTFYSEALVALNKEKRDLGKSADRESLESRVDASDPVNDDDEFEFWQPDNVVTLADTLSIPQSKSRHEELRSLILRELHHVPHRLRQEFNLVYQSGLTIGEVARIVGRSSALVEKDIKQVLSMLKKKFSKL